MLGFPRLSPSVLSSSHGSRDGLFYAESFRFRRGEGGFVGFPPADENRRQRRSIHRLRGDDPHGTTSTKNPPFIFQSGSRRGRSSFFSGMGTNTRGWGGFLASPGSAASHPPLAARG